MRGCRVPFSGRPGGGRGLAKNWPWPLVQLVFHSQKPAGHTLQGRMGMSWIEWRATPTCWLTLTSSSRTELQILNRVRQSWQGASFDDGIHVRSPRSHGEGLRVGKSDLPEESCAATSVFHGFHLRLTVSDTGVMPAHDIGIESAFPNQDHHIPFPGEAQVAPMIHCAQVRKIHGRGLPVAMEAPLKPRRAGKGSCLVPTLIGRNVLLAFFGIGGQSLRSCGSKWL